MIQNLYSNNYKFSPCFTQSNQLYNSYPYNKEVCLQRINKKKSSESKKSVTFNPNIDVINVESWKKYNSDMSEETEYMQIKRKIAALKEKKKLGKIKDVHDYCDCNIF